MKNIIDTITKNLYLQQNFLVCLAELDALTTVSFSFFFLFKEEEEEKFN